MKRRKKEREVGREVGREEGRKEEREKRRKKERKSVNEMRWRDTKTWERNVLEMEGRWMKRKKGGCLYAEVKTYKGRSI